MNRIFNFDKYVNNIPLKNQVPVLSSRDIEQIAHQVLVDVSPTSLTECKPVPVEMIMENAFALTISPKTMDPRNDVLGQTYFMDMSDQFYLPDSGTWEHILINRKTVVLDEFLYEYEPERLLFTEGHELGHWLLHQEYYTQKNEIAARTQTFREEKTCFQGKSPLAWTEWQADCFASCLLLPREPVREIVRNYLNEHSLQWKQLVNFQNPMMRSHFIEVSVKLGHTMGVSRDCARIRLEKLFNVHYPHS